MTLPSMPSLLEAHGCRIRTAGRADCADCAGRSRATVAFTAEVAFCHRCQWRASRFTLARQLGVIGHNAESIRELRGQERRRRSLESILAAFENWREARLRETTSRYRVLGLQAALACQVLSRWPECDPAWNALARFYHDEARLCSVLDWLAFTKASVWLHRDSTPTEVFAAWRAIRVAS